MRLIDGKEIAADILQQIKADIAKLPGRKPGLAFLLVGDNEASQTYVHSKSKACAECGIHSVLRKLPTNTTEAHLLREIEQLNNDPTIDGILVQLPLPSHIDEKAITFAIDPKKDVDGFHPLNLGLLLRGDPSAIVPCTPRGIHTLLLRTGISLEGKHVVIVGRSNIVGKPLAALLVQKHPSANATVTIAHSKSLHLAEITRSADILIAAIGQPHFIQASMVRKGAVVIDVGINRKDGKIVGDVDFAAVSPIASHITPVPGGVGPMTIAMLLQNTLQIRLTNP
ncbi:MAG: bifunctional methylenetetrahydrofolate dehydrogenase/methenyltetrahydrofolate cyclohydrolase FolD [Verrucomicrobiota bacterium]|nr:bifunctional methylenetetrahydrofolate dehydrogenase/methenyltetrahydrofolate cyclohydrolase FolD [Verrucomicrobiota bacterium]